jgi:two-component sensor histidine kinase
LIPPLLAKSLPVDAIQDGELASGNGAATLAVCDDGPGFPPGFAWQQAASTGLSLIGSTGRHDLRGTIDYANRPDGGARANVLFPIPDMIRYNTATLSPH